MNHYLSKSLYTRGQQCHKSLWLKKYKPEVLDLPSESQKQLFKTGNMVGRLACNLFPGGKEIKFEGSSFDEKVLKTRKLIEEGQEIIYEASFNYQNIFIMIDILRKVDSGWEIYEVKSSSTFKDIHIHDLNIQRYVAEGAGLTIAKTFIVHINSKYELIDSLNVNDYFVIKDIDLDNYEFDIDIQTSLANLNDV